MDTPAGNVARLDVDAFDLVERRLDAIVAAATARLAADGIELDPTLVRFHVRHLAHAVARGTPAPFVRTMRWAGATHGRDHPMPSALRAMLDALAAAVDAHLPPPLAARCRRVIAAAVDLPPGGGVEGARGLDPADPLHDLCRGWLDDLLAGRRHEARNRLVGALERGEASPREIYRHVLEPAQREVGRLWQLGRISVAQEHFCTAATQIAMATLYPRIFAAPRRGRTALVASVGGELHEVGARMVADYFTMAGWDTHYLGADTPAAAVAETARTIRADVVALSCTMLHNAREVARIVADVREGPGLPVVLVGGRAFQSDPELCAAVDADGTAESGEGAVETAELMLRRRAPGSPAACDLTACAAAVATAEGLLVEALHDDLDLWRGLPPGASIAQRLSRPEGRALLEAVAAAADGAVREVPVTCPPDRGEGRVRARAGSVGVMRVVVVAPEGADLDAMFRDFREAAALRVERVTGPAAEARAGGVGGEPLEPLLAEMSRLNNELLGAQRELHRQNERLRRLDREKNELLGMVAHDLRHPLAVVSGLCDALADEGPGEERRQLLERIDDRVTWMARLVDDLLDVAAIEAGSVRLEVRRFDLGALIERDADLSRVLAGRKRIRIDIERPQDPIEVDGDARKIDQVVMNLLQNAIKFSPAGGVVRVRVERTPTEAAVSVRDEGPGMAPEVRDRLFRDHVGRGARGSAGEKGTGLGLLISGRIVERHGGTCRVDSEPGRGSTVGFTLPLRGAGQSSSDGSRTT